MTQEELNVLRRKRKQRNERAAQGRDDDAYALTYELGQSFDVLIDEIDYLRYKLHKAMDFWVANEMDVEACQFCDAAIRYVTSSKVTCEHKPDCLYVEVNKHLFA